MRVAVLLAVTLAGACSGKSGAEAERRSADQERIRLAVARAVEALNAGDVEAMVAMHTSDAVVLNPLFSPRGEPKCVRGPSVRGARRLTSAGVLDCTLSTASKRNEGLAGLSRASAVRW